MNKESQAVDHLIKLCAANPSEHPMHVLAELVEKRVRVLAGPSRPDSDEKINEITDAISDRLHNGCLVAVALVCRAVASPDPLWPGYKEEEFLNPIRLNGNNPMKCQCFKCLFIRSSYLAWCDEMPIERAIEQAANEQNDIIEKDDEANGTTTPGRKGVGRALGFTLQNITIPQPSLMPGAPEVAGNKVPPQIIEMIAKNIAQNELARLHASGAKPTAAALAKAVEEALKAAGLGEFIKHMNVQAVHLQPDGTISQADKEKLLLNGISPKTLDGIEKNPGLVQSDLHSDDPPEPSGNSRIQNN